MLFLRALTDVVRFAASLRWWAASALAFLAAACAPRTTELVVVVRSDVAVPVEMDRVQIDVAGATQASFSEEILLAEQPLPLTFGLRPASGDSGNVRITVIGRRGASERVRRVVRTMFVPGERRLLVIELEMACVGLPACSEGSTCRGGTCVSATVDPSTLPVFTGQIPGVDAGVDAGPDAPRDAPSDAPDASFDAPDGGPDAPSCEGDAGTMGMPTGCTLRRAPARPTCGDGGDDGMTYTSALLDPIIYQPGATWATYGYDLDALCTDPLAPMPQFECTTMGGMPPSDGTEGSDNTFGSTITSPIVAFYPDLQDGLQRGMRRGSAVPIVRFSGWNGEANDGVVDAHVAFAVDVLPAGTPVPPGGLLSDNRLPNPAWDGTDTAYASSTYFTSAPTSLPLIRDDNAYVVDHQLVIALPGRAPIDLPTRTGGVLVGVARIRLTDARLIVQLGPDGVATRGTLIGRWAQTDVLAYLDDLGVCPGDPVVDTFLAAFTALLPRSLDVRSMPPSPSPMAPCDAVSLAVPFTAGEAVIWGGIEAEELLPADCP